MTRQELFQEMAAIGAVSVWVRYWSGGDEGAVEEVNAHSYSPSVATPCPSELEDDGVPVGPAGDIVVPKSLVDALGDFYTATIYDDSQETEGVLVFDVPAGTVTAYDAIPVWTRRPPQIVE